MSEFILHYVSENRYFVPGASEKILQYITTFRVYRVRLYCGIVRKIGKFREVLGDWVSIDIDRFYEVLGQFPQFPEALGVSTVIQ